MRSHRSFNLLMLALATGLGLSNLWLWRGYFVSAAGPALAETHLALAEMFGRGESGDAPSEVAAPTNAGQGTQTSDGSISNVSVSSSGQDTKKDDRALLAVSSTATASSAVPLTKDLPSKPDGLRLAGNADSLLTGQLALGPGDMNLKVPYASQAPERNWEEPWQDACEEAALLMLDAYYKGYGLSPLFAKDEMLKMIAWEEERGWGRSIAMEKVRQIAVDYLQLRGDVKIIEDPAVEQIKNFVARGQPVLLVAYGKVLPNRFYSRGGPEYHALIVRGYTADKFITNDPGVNRGENFPFSMEDVMNSIHDWNDGDVPRGRRVALVVEE